jgi:hypothetical protein
MIEISNKEVNVWGFTGEPYGPIDRHDTGIWREAYHLQTHAAF